MAIERQERRARLPRIGVVNVNTGADRTWQTLASTVDGIANNLAPVLRPQAVEKGTNAAKAVKKQNLIS